MLRIQAAKSKISDVEQDPSLCIHCECLRTFVGDGKKYSKGGYVMKNTIPELPKGSRYSIKETCEILGIHRNTLLKYTDSGIIKCGFRKATMRKYYSGEEITKLWKTVC